jgi:hypothetical protein
MFSNFGQFVIKKANRKLKHFFVKYKNDVIVNQTQIVFYKIEILKALLNVIIVILIPTVI